MLIRRKKGWELPERIATPEARFADRRRLLAGMGIGGLILAAPAAMGPLGPKSDAASRVVPRHSARPDEALASFYPAPRNARYEIDRPLGRATCDELQQFLRIRFSQGYLRRGASPSNPAVGGAH